MNEELHKMFMDELSELFYAENKIAEALPKMEENATNKKLKEGFAKHLRQTHEQIKRIQEASDILGERLAAKENDIITSIIKHGEEVMEKPLLPDVMDAVIISKAQGVEHYEIPAYGTLIEWAKEMGHNEVADLLKKSLDEEEKTDKLLSELAESEINKKASGKD